MNKIDELLKNEKVEWKKLGESKVCLSITTGLNPRKNFKLNDSTEGELTSWYITTKDYSKNEDIEFIEGKTARITEQARRLINKRSKLEINDILFSAVGTVGKIAFVDVEPNNFDVNESTFILKPNKKNIIPKYLVHYLRSDFIQNEVKKSLKGSTLAGIRKNKLEELMIPIPTIETQEKIVETLDKFTNYVTELQAALQSELQARNKQYKYYRDMLLSEEYLKKISEKFVNYKEEYEVKKFTIEDIAKIKNGKDWKTLGKGNTPVYGSGGKMDVCVNEHSYNKPTVLIPRKGSIENIFYVDEPFWNVDTIYYTEIDETKIKPKYFYYFMKTIDLKSLSTNSTRPSLTQSILNKIEINVPPIAIQNKVVEILDKFQSLLSDTQGLLPEEIEIRQKQYEYYREKLLTFKDNVVTHTHTHTQLISSSYFNILHEACDILNINIASNYFYKLSECTLNIEKINWNNLRELDYIDLSSINRESNSIIETTKIDKNNAPSRAKQLVKEGDILFGTTRPTLKRYYKVEKCYDGQVCSTGFCVLRADTKKVIPKWIYYSIRTSKFFQYIKINEVGTSYPSISDTKVKDYRILVPPIYVQDYVVSILDKFDKLVNDINEGLPKEIELRQKQYEYYRERLLNFPK